LPVTEVFLIIKNPNWRVAKRFITFDSRSVDNNSLTSARMTSASTRTFNDDNNTTALARTINDNTSALARTVDAKAKAK